jgi:hypothetical protein
MNGKTDVGQQSAPPPERNGGPARTRRQTSPRISWEGSFFWKKPVDKSALIPASAQNLRSRQAFGRDLNLLTRWSWGKRGKNEDGIKNDEPKPVPPGQTIFILKATWNKAGELPDEFAYFSHSVGMLTL